MRFAFVLQKSGNLSSFSTTKLAAINCVLTCFFRPDPNIACWIAPHPQKSLWKASHNFKINSKIKL